MKLRGISDNGFQRIAGKRADQYQEQAEQYAWYVVNMTTGQVESGFEYREDAVDLVNEMKDFSDDAWKVHNVRTVDPAALQEFNQRNGIQ